MRQFLVVFLLVVGVRALAPPVEERRTYIVLDIDHVLVFPATGEVPPDERYVQVDTVLGRLAHRKADGVLEFLDSLFAEPDVEVSFASTGHADRNDALLRQLILCDGTSAYHNADVFLGREECLRPALQGRDIHPGAAYPEIDKKNMKKDLELVARGDVRDVVLVDNTASSAMKGQEDNLLWIFDPFPENFWRRFNANGSTELNWVESVIPQAQEYVDGGQDQKARLLARAFFHFRNQLFYARGMLDLVLEAVRSTGRPAAEILGELHWVRENRLFLSNRKWRDDMEIYRRGLEAMRRFNPELRLTAMDPAELKLPHCASEFWWAAE